MNDHCYCKAWGLYIPKEFTQEIFGDTVLPTESCIFKGNSWRPNFIPEDKFFLGYKNVSESLMEHLA